MTRTSTFAPALFLLAAGLLSTPAQAQFFGQGETSTPDLPAGSQTPYEEVEAYDEVIPHFSGIIPGVRFRKTVTWRQLFDEGWQGPFRKELMGAVIHAGVDARRSGTGIWENAAPRRAEQADLRRILADYTSSRRMSFERIDATEAADSLDDRRRALSGLFYLVRVRGDQLCEFGSLLAKAREQNLIIPFQIEHEFRLFFDTFRRLEQTLLSHDYLGHEYRPTGSSMLERAQQSFPGLVGGTQAPRTNPEVFPSS